MRQLTAWLWPIGLLLATGSVSGCAFSPKAYEGDNTESLEADPTSPEGILDAAADGMSPCDALCTQEWACIEQSPSDQEFARCLGVCELEYERLADECQDAAVDWAVCQAVADCEEPAPDDDTAADCEADRDTYEACTLALGSSTDVTQLYCCSEDDPCTLENDGVCDCGGASALVWDAADCSFDEDYPICCTADDDCELEDNGRCDCADESWDADDCSELLGLLED